MSRLAARSKRGSLDFQRAFCSPDLIAFTFHFCPSLVHDTGQTSSTIRVDSQADSKSLFRFHSKTFESAFNVPNGIARLRKIIGTLLKS